MKRWENNGSKSPHQYDFAVAGIPFLSAASKEYPYLRESIDPNKQQINTTVEVGEQSLGNWWYRSQSSFDLGAGVQFSDTARDANVSRRFFESFGIDSLTTISEAKLDRKINALSLDDVSSSSPVKKVLTTLRGFYYLVGNKVTGGTTFGGIYNGDTDSETVLDFTTDGTTLYILTNKSIHRRIPGDISGSQKVLTLPFTALRGKIYFMKERLVFNIDNTQIRALGVPATSGQSVIYQAAPTPYGAIKTYSPNTIEVAGATASFAEGIRFIFGEQLGWKVGDKISSVTNSSVSQFNSATELTVVNVDKSGLQIRVSPSGPLPTNKAIKDNTKEAIITLLLPNTPIEIYRGVSFSYNASGNTNIGEPGSMRFNTSAFTSLTEGTQGIYISGFSGNKSVIFFSGQGLTRENDGVPTLNTPYIVAELPEGEIINDIASYLGVYLVVGTSKGLRVGIIDNRNSIVLGPLLFTDSAILSITFDGDYCYAYGVEGNANINDFSFKDVTYKINLSKTTEDQSLLFAYQKVFHTGLSTYFELGELKGQIHKHVYRDRFYIIRDGLAYATSYTDYIGTGELTLGKARLDTAEDKVFQYLKVSMSLPTGTEIEVKFKTNTELNSIPEWRTLRTFRPTDADVIAGAGVVEIPGSYSSSGSPSEPGYSPYKGHQWIQYKFVLKTTVANKTPILYSYQIKATPHNVKQQLIRLPLMLLNKEKATNGSLIQRSVFDRLRVIEKAEQEGEVVKFQDFRSGEERNVIVEKMQFFSNHIPESTTDEHSGLLILQVRTVDLTDTTGSTIG